MRVCKVICGVVWSGPTICICICLPLARFRFHPYRILK